MAAPVNRNYGYDLIFIFSIPGWSISGPCANSTSEGAERVYLQLLLRIESVFLLQLWTDESCVVHLYLSKDGEPTEQAGVDFCLRSSQFQS
jgi:hypothetical protein